MISALKIAATGMQAQQLNVDVLSNNISNLNTTAYKKQQTAFKDLLYQSRIGVGSLTSETGTTAPTGAQTGLGVAIGSIYRVMTQGSVVQTGGTYDIAIQGRGYFNVTMPDGETQYTRDGTFQIDQNGALVTKEGYLVDPSITVPDNAVDVTINELGVVSGSVDGTVTQFGTITLSMFQNEAGLEATGGNRFRQTESSGTAVTTNVSENGSGTLLQFHVEGANVDPIESITELITAQRAYELNSRVISTADEMLSAANQIR